MPFEQSDRVELLAQLLAGTRPTDDADYEGYLAVVFGCFADLDNEARANAVTRAKTILRYDGVAGRSSDLDDFAKRCDAHADALLHELRRLAHDRADHDQTDHDFTQ